jgi:alkyl hydroperoxide reductase subunit D
MTPSLVTAAVPAANLAALRNAMPDFAKDIKLNLGTVLAPEGAPDLTQQQIHLIALASSYATQNAVVMSVMESEVALDDAQKNAAKAAASVMAMNNVYYRFIHLAGSDEIKKLPAKLRMNVIGSPGVPKVDFELMCLAISAINGCGMCIESHTHELSKAGCSALAIQSSVRIAAVINAAAQVANLS